MVAQFYPAIIVANGDGFSVVFPDFPGCVTQAPTVAEAAKQATEALALHAGGILEDGGTLPAPSLIDAPLPDWAASAAGGIRVLVPAEVSCKAARVNITIDEALLGRINAAAAQSGFTRSGFFAQAAREKLAKRTV